MHRYSLYTDFTESISTYGMPSKFEHALLLCKEDNDVLRKTLWSYLDSATLRRLRRVSRVLHDLVDHQPGRLFRQLYVPAPLAPFQDTNSLEIVAPYCHNLTVNVNGIAHGSRKRSFSQASTSPWSILNVPCHSLDMWRDDSGKGTPPDISRVSSPIRSLQRQQHANTNFRASMAPGELPFLQRELQDKTREIWSALLSRFRQLREITLRINGDAAWSGRTEVEDMLVTLRIAVERANLPHLKVIKLTPVHAMGVIHLRWQGAGAFGEALGSEAAVWTKIETLDLRIHNPSANGKLTDAQLTMFRKILHDYLRSFAQSLHCLRFVWLGGDGPSPLTLHLEPDLTGRPEIIWPNLKELWIGNIKLPHQTIYLTSRLAPSLTRIRTLRSTRRDSSMDTTDSSAWVDVLQVRQSGPSGRKNSTASSIYSQNATSPTSPWLGGISRSSRDLQFMLDL